MLQHFGWDLLENCRTCWKVMGFLLKYLAHPCLWQLSGRTCWEYHSRVQSSPDGICSATWSPAAHIFPHSCTGCFCTYPPGTTTYKTIKWALPWKYITYNFRNGSCCNSDFSHYSKPTLFWLLVNADIKDELRNDSVQFEAVWPLCTWVNGK